MILSQRNKINAIAELMAIGRTVFEVNLLALYRDLLVEIIVSLHFFVKVIISAIEAKVEISCWQI